MDFSLKGMLLLVLPTILRILIAIGIGSLTWAVVNERRMQRHRQPGVTYGEVTLRKDGAWRRADLFTEQGLAYQRQAARWGLTGVIAVLAAFFTAWLLSSVST